MVLSTADSVESTVPSHCVVRGACVQEMGEEGNRFTRQLKETLFRLGFEPDQIGVRLVYSELSLCSQLARVEGTCTVGAF